jgi:hypothetical protein
LAIYSKTRDIRERVKEKKKRDDTKQLHNYKKAISNNYFFICFLGCVPCGDFSKVGMNEANPQHKDWMVIVQVLQFFPSGSFELVIDFHFDIEW